MSTTSPHFEYMVYYNAWQLTCYLSRFRYVELALNYIFDNVWLIENKVKELELELEPEPEQKYPKQAFVDNALNPMYNKIYRLIAKDPKEQQLLAHRIIKWLLCEVYPLPAKELIKGVCMDASSPEAKVLNEKNKSGLLDVNDVLSACHHLVVYYKSTDRLDFGHFSVVEFLKGPSMAIFENSMAHCTLSSACFHVLFSITDFNSLDTDRQLETYAMFNWAWHYKNSEEPEGVTDVQNLFSKFWKEDEYFSKTVASTESRIVSFVDHHGERKESGAIFRTIASQWSSLSLGRTLQLPKREQQLIVGCVFDLCEPVKELLALRTWYFGRNLEISPSSIVIGCKLALRFGSLRALEELVEGPVDTDMLEADGCPLLHHAVSTLNLKSVKFCLGRFSRAINIVATSFIEESWNTTQLIVALLSMDYRNPRNDKDTIMELWRVPGIDVNASGSGGRTALHVAMSSSSVTPEIVKELVEHGCKGIFQRDYDGMTPMVIGEREREHNAASLAAEFARTGAQGAEGEGEERTNIEVDDASRKLRLLDDAEPPVQKAAREGNDPTDLDAIIKESKWEGKAILDLTTALHLAAENANMGCLKVLLKSGLVDVDSQDGNGMTALMAAVLSRKWDVVKFLRSQGASPTMETQQGRSALTFAAKEGKLNGLKAVLSAIPGRDTVDVNHQDTFGGLTALHYACMKRFNEEIEPPGKFDENLDLVEELLFHGADIHIMDNNGRTPLQIAMIHGKHDVVAKLSGLGPQDSQAEGTTIQSEIDHPTITSQGNTIQNIQADKQILRVEFYTFIHFLYAIAWWLARGTRALFLGVLSTMIPPGALHNDTSSAKDGMVRDNFASWSSISAVVPGATQGLELDEEFEKSLSRFM